jgi:hypothetical protein
MIVVVLGISAALVAAVLHGVMVRWLPRRMRVTALAGFCLTSLGIFAGTIWVLDLAVTSQQVLLASILAASLVVDYAIVFTGIESDSPTLSIVNEILDRGADGLPADALAEFASRRPFVQSRIDALLGAGVLAGEDNLSAAPGGVGLLVRITEIYRRLCGYQKETG